MSTERLNTRLSLVANLAVIVGLAFLAIELQQSNQIARASIELDVKNNFAVINEAIYTNSDLAELLEKCRVPDPVLTGTESRKLSAFSWQLINTWLAIEEAFDNGMVSEATYGTVEDNARYIMRTFPGLSPQFLEWLASFPSLADGGVFQTIEKQLEDHGLTDNSPL